MPVLVSASRAWKQLLARRCSSVGGTGSNSFNRHPHVPHGSAAGKAPGKRTPTRTQGSCRWAGGFWICVRVAFGMTVILQAVAPMWAFV